MRPVVLAAGVRRGWRVLLSGCLIFGVLGLGAVDAQAATSLLTGEALIGVPSLAGSLTGTCAEGSFSFVTNGNAFGPFPGTFTESGRFTVGPDGYLTGFFSNFTIFTTNAGKVTGAKFLTPHRRNLTYSCSPTTNGTSLKISGIPFDYTADFADGSVDQGIGYATIVGIVGQAPNTAEGFGPIGIGTAHKQCQQDAWNSFGAPFKNQGDCVSFFTTGGKNPPSG
jgi:hypothetical protein